MTDGVTNTINLKRKGTMRGIHSDHDDTSDCYATLTRGRRATNMISEDRTLTREEYRAIYGV